MYFGSAMKYQDAGAGGFVEPAARASETGYHRMQMQSARHDIERLLMITEALWSVLKEQHGYTDEELFRRVSEIDLRDGRLDGRVAPGPPSACPHCGRIMNRGRPICIFCGRASVANPFDR